MAQQQSAWCLSQSTCASVVQQSHAAPRDLTGTTMLTGDTPSEDMPLMKLKQDMLEMEMALPREAVMGLDRETWRVRMPPCLSSCGGTQPRECVSCHGCPALLAKSAGTHIPPARPL